MNASNNKTILITGAAGQIAHYLIDHILSLDEGYKIYAVYHKRFPLETRLEVNYIQAKLNANYTINHLVRALQPDIVINLAAISMTNECERLGIKTVLDINTVVVGEFLEAIRLYCPKTRLFNAGSSEQFINKSLYSLSKQLSNNLITHYRAAYDIFAIQGIIYPNISIHQNSNSFISKIISCVSDVKRGLDQSNSNFKSVKIGNINTKSSLMFSGDMARGIWKAINYPYPTDFKLAGYETLDNKQIIERICHRGLRLNGSWKTLNGEDSFWLEGIGADSIFSKLPIFITDKEYKRPDEKHRVCDSNHLVYNTLAWCPTTRINDVITEMVDAKIS